MAEHVRVFEPNPKQWLFLQATERHVCFGGARAGGKSWVTDVKAVLLARKYGAPDRWSMGIRICIIRRTLKDVEKNHLQQLKLLIGPYAKYNDNKKTFFFKNGATITLAYCDNDKDSEHLQGIDFDVIFFEEATQLQPHWMTDIAASIRGVNNFPHRCYYTCNPGGPGHAYIRRLFVDRQFRDTENPDDYRFIQAKYTDNTALMKYSPEYKTFLDNLPPKRRAAWRDGSWDIYEGQYFNDFVNDPAHYGDGKNTHVIDPVPIRKHWTIYRGLDWGHFRPFAVAWYAISEDGIMYRFKELYGVQKAGGDSLANEGVQWPPEQVFRTIREIESADPDLKGRSIIGIADPAIFKTQGGPSIADTGMDCGVYFQEGDNTRIPGWMQCRYRLQFNEYGIPRFYVFNTCKEFIRTIPLLQHDEKNVEDLDTTGEDHIADEWRYVCMANVIKPIIPEPEYRPEWGADPLNMFGGAA